MNGVRSQESGHELEGQHDAGLEVADLSLSGQGRPELVQLVERERGVFALLEPLEEATEPGREGSTCQGAVPVRIDHGSELGVKVVAGLLSSV